MSGLVKVTFVSVEPPISELPVKLLGLVSRIRNITQSLSLTHQLTRLARGLLRLPTISARLGFCRRCNPYSTNASRCRVWLRKAMNNGNTATLLRNQELKLRRSSPTFDIHLTP